MHAHPQHALLPFQRHAIYEQLGTLENATGYTRRTWLGVLATERVLSVWHEVRPHDHRPEDLLTLAKDVVQGQLDRRVASKEAKETWHWFINEEGDRAYLRDIKQTPRALFAIGAAIGALLLAVGIDIVHEGLNDAEATDADIDPWSADVAEWAVDAYAGPTWEPDSDSAKRLEFWTWWLTEAVPAAWNTAG